MRNSTRNNVVSFPCLLSQDKNNGITLYILENENRQLNFAIVYKSRMRLRVENQECFGVESSFKKAPNKTHFPTILDT